MFFFLELLTTEKKNKFNSRRYRHYNIAKVHTHKYFVHANPLVAHKTSSSSQRISIKIIEQFQVSIRGVTSTAFTLSNIEYEHSVNAIQSSEICIKVYVSFVRIPKIQAGKETCVEIIQIS